MVVVIIGVVSASGLMYYEKAMDDARRVGVEILANRFTAAVALIRGQWIVESTIRVKSKSSYISRVDVDNMAIFLNEFGWPANTDGRSTSSDDQTAEECAQIWRSILQNPAPVTIEGRGDPADSGNPENKGRQRYHVSQIDNHVCRYELLTDPMGTHYFDYNLKNGLISVNVPPLD